MRDSGYFRFLFAYARLAPDPPIRQYLKRHFAWSLAPIVGALKTLGKTGRTMPVAAHKELLGLSGTLREVKPIAAHKTDPPQFDQGTQQRGFLLTAERLGSDEDARQRLHVRLRSDIYGATTKA